MIQEKIERLLVKEAKRMKTLQFAMNLPTAGISYSFSSTVPNQHFHSASAGKLMTTTLIFVAIEQKKLTLDTKVNSILKPEVLDGLFQLKDKDYQSEVTVRHLLSHTSGVNDYYESKTFDGSSFTSELIRNQDKFWTPLELLDYTRSRQKAVAKPGEKFFYSDTGYILLGLIIETVFELPFHRALEVYLFRPANMQETQLCFYSDDFDQNALAPLYINGVDVHLFKSLSADFSGGGLSTTTGDLLRFLDHLQNGQIIHPESIDQMGLFNHRYRQGLYYGLGMMQVRFEKFFFLLKGLPRLQGHIGVTGVHAWYDPNSKATFAMNVGNTKDIAASFKLLIKIMQQIKL